MNLKIVNELVKIYKENYSKIHDPEIYKWKAVKCFQENWDINASDFHLMISKALAKTVNLLSSQNYLPKQQLLAISEREPNQVKNLFISLFDESIIEDYRIDSFIESLKKLGEKIFNWEKQDTDHRAVVVYLTLKYPEKYFFYKFSLLKGFAKRVEYPYIPIKGHEENIQHYFNLCKIIKSEILKDNELIQLHKNRLTVDCYFDKNFNILTQDVIYEIENRLSGISNQVVTKIEISFPKPIIKLAKDFKLKQYETKLNPIFINQTHEDNENKLIGNLGELWVIRFEENRLKQLNLKNKISKIEHTSILKGDGAGYDIKSFDEDGNEIFIEVKTTIGNFDNPFYITKNELEKSKLNPDNYYLYRVYNFNKIENIANLEIIKGSLLHLCYNPILYKASIKE